MSTLGVWLEERRHGVPETLWRHLNAHVTACGVRDTDALPGLQRAAQEQLVRMRTLSGEARADASDLLVADALVTYALELAATECVDDLDAFAGELMTMIAHR